MGESHGALIAQDAAVIAQWVKLREEARDCSAWANGMGAVYRVCGEYYEDEDHAARKLAKAYRANREYTIRRLLLNPVSFGRLRRRPVGKVVRADVPKAKRVGRALHTAMTMAGALV